MIVTACREDQQIARMMARDGFTEEEARQRLAAQMPTAEKIAKADYVIDTSGTKEETNDQIDVVFDKLVDLVQPAGR